MGNLACGRDCILIGKHDHSGACVGDHFVVRDKAGNLAIVADDVVSANIAREHAKAVSSPLPVLELHFGEHFLVALGLE